MTISPYFHHYDDNVEQDLIEDLVAETIQQRGVDLFYLPRTLENESALYGEDPGSSFNSAHQIEALITSVDEFEGEGDFFSKIGMQINDSARMVISQKRFRETITGIIKNINHARTGDLIYIPFMKNLFEIISVKNDQPFYQLGDNYVFDLRIEMFEFSHETFNTGVEDIDNYARSLLNNNDVSNDLFADNDDIETLADGTSADSYSDDGTNDRGTGPINFNENDVFGDY